MSDCVLTVRVTPRSASDEVIGWQDEALRVRLRAPPVDGKATEALRRLLAARLDVALSAVQIVSGGTSRTKRLRVEGLTEAEARARLDV
jgi:uncharacterized protein (TIGR00251 family)